MLWSGRQQLSEVIFLQPVASLAKTIKCVFLQPIPLQVVCFSGSSLQTDCNLILHAIQREEISGLTNSNCQEILNPQTTSSV